ncbi:Zn-ribbon domain-containing OB-fold protein [Streptomyces tanashiensis]|uniref:Zn-ribbon domain-containing OB-fold protein n=1 Tax=Streptomyces tanashiensis TaxID=67367 RepID=UPI0036E3A785
MPALSATEVFDVLCAPLIADCATKRVGAEPPDGARSASLAEEVRFGGLKDGVLYFQRCRWCKTPAFRRVLCPACASPDLELEPSEGTGIVSRSTVVRRNDVPLTLFLIAMGEGFQLQGVVVGAARFAVHPGTCVALVADTADDARNLVFKLRRDPCSDRW